MDIWNCRYSEFYQGPMTDYLPLYSTILSVSFFLWSSIGIYLQSSHHWHYYYIFLCCECQSLSMPNKACPKVQSFLVFGLFFYWFLNYTRGRAFRREISKIHRVNRKKALLIAVEAQSKTEVSYFLLLSSNSQTKRWLFSWDRRGTWQENKQWA